LPSPVTRFPADPKRSERLIALLRQTPTNRYTLNAVTAILDCCGVAWVAFDDLDCLAGAASRSPAPVLVLYSFMTLRLPEVRREVDQLRVRAPRALLLAGGAHPTADPEGTLASGFHHVFVGEAEETLPAFLSDPAGSSPVLRAAEVRADALDRYPAFGRGRYGPVEMSRGCAFGCAFCAVGGGPQRHRSEAAVLAAVELLQSRGRRTLSFITPDALSYGGGLASLESLLERLERRGAMPSLGIFPSEVRPERVTPEAVALLRRFCRNRALVIGAQSGSDAVLRRLGRGHGVRDVERAACVARQGGFLPHVDLIFGLPGETPEERQSTVDLARRLRRETGAKIHAHYFHSLPGTPLWGREPTPLDRETRRFLGDLRAGGGEDGYWQEQERWAWEILDWGRRGWIRTPFPTAPSRA
jgi:B12-binding domain/radical SAM domain protein